MATDLQEICILFNRLPNNLVINVSDVHAKFDVVPEIISHDSANNIEAHVSSCMSHVRLIINSRSTSVPSYLEGIIRYKKILKLLKKSYFLFGKRVGKYNTCCSMFNSSRLVCCLISVHYLRFSTKYC